MRGMIGSVLVLLGFFTVAAAQLPPEILLDAYLLQAEQAVRAGDPDRAQDVMQNILLLQEAHELDLPDDFHFRYAQVAFSAGSIQATIDSVNQYLTASGRDGEFYREALELLDDAEQNLPENVAGRYMLQADRQISEGNYGSALDLMNEAVALQREHDLTLPDEFDFKYAQVAFSAGLNEAAIDSVNEYLATAGEESEFRRDAQELLNKAKQELLDEANEGLPEMVEIPGGRFRMGCVSGKSCDGDEKPVYEVRIRPFMLSKYEVTFEEYDYFANETGFRQARQVWGRGQLPVINISWYDAVAYTEWLSARTGEPYRLPTEAEWEYAARAGSTTQYSWGDEVGDNRANCDGCGSRWDDTKAAPVGSFSANAWGLHDMHGNVQEWVQDCWNGNYRAAPTDGSARESGDCEERVLRGGSWNFPSKDSRAAARRRLNAIRRGGGEIRRLRWYDFVGVNSDKRVDDYAGFRVARTITP